VKFIDEFRDRELIARLVDRIMISVNRPMTFMEVCGGHTNAIHRFGIPHLLPAEISLLSGPGCPVCVTGREYIDKAVGLCEMKDVIITTFGDLIRVPGSESTLEKKQSAGADIRIVLSALDALEIASGNPGKHIIFLAIGFETTAPGTAATVKKAHAEGINNFSILCAHKIMPPAMEAIIREGTDIDGFICPGHVAAITGSEIFRFIPERYGLGCVVTGFEPVDLLQAILMLTHQVVNKSPTVEIEYGRAVSKEGNTKAISVMNEVFESCDASWRGLGVIPGSGLALRSEFERYDADTGFLLSSGSVEDDVSCICGEILRGKEKPVNCPLFASVCTPDNPVGACMVSQEGACNNWYKYNSHE
jgi:hydrogenase expression/formation protein HypD